MGVIPNNFSLTYGGGPQIIHLDTAVTRTGKPSIRLDQHTASDVNIWRECDGTWYQVKPGDHIVITVWVKTGLSGLSPDPSVTPGGRIGIDFYGHTSAGYGILYVNQIQWIGALGEPNYWGNPLGPNDHVINNWWVPYNKDWTMIGWDVIVPSNWCSYVSRGGSIVPITTPVQVDSFVPWFDVRSPSNPGKVWFADAELYINPVAVTPPATAYTLTVVGSSGGTTSLPPGLYTYTAVTDVPVQAIPSQGYKFSKWFLDGVDQTPWWPTAQFTVWKMAANHTLQAVFTALPSPPSDVRIAVSSVTASSNDGCYVPNMAIDGIENPSNYWGTNAQVSQGCVPQWLKLDLGGVRRINTVTTHFYDGSVRTYTYYLEVSNDSSSWTTIVSTKTGRGSVTDMFSQVGARFVRITITANTANLAAHIEEIKVYGFS